MFVTLFFGVLNTATGGLAYVNAGHEPLFIIGPDGVKGGLERTGPAVGLIPEARYIPGEIVLDPEDVLFGYTDGVTEAKSPEQDLFTRQRLLTILAQSPPSGTELLERINAALETHVKDAPQSDDITMLAVRRQA
jgi:sigma-B regulation protein RsbU (phosphoserine phosphatase)